MGRHLTPPPNDHIAELLSARLSRADLLSPEKLPLYLGGAPSSTNTCKPMTIDTTIELPEPSVYRTADRGLAGALMALGFDLLGAERGHDQVMFAFPMSRMLLDAADAFMVDTLSVSANRMAQAIEQLEDLAGGWGAIGSFDLDDL